MGGEESVVALAVLQPASGPRRSGAPITAATLPEHAPDPGAARSVARVLEAAGFTVGPLVGIAMSVSGSSEAFQRYFGARIEHARDGGWVAVGASGEATRELPLSAVPDEIADILEAVTFEEPAEPVDGETDTGGAWP